MTASATEQPSECERSSFLGVFLLAFGLLIFSFQDVIIRWLSGGLAVHQIVFMRGAIALWPIGGYVVWRFGWPGFRVVRPAARSHHQPN